MIKEKGNQFEMTHKAAAQKMQKNVSTAAALAGSLALQNKLTSPQAPQPPLKNATALQQPQGQNALVQPAHQPVAVANPPPAQLVKPVQEPLGLNKGLEVGDFYFSAFVPGKQERKSSPVDIKTMTNCSKYFFALTSMNSTHLLLMFFSYEDENHPVYCFMHPGMTLSSSMWDKV